SGEDLKLGLSLLVSPLERPEVHALVCGFDLQASKTIKDELSDVLLKPFGGDNRRLATGSVPGVIAAVDGRPATPAVAETAHRVAAISAAHEPGEQELGVRAALSAGLPLAADPGLGVGERRVRLGIDEVVAVSDLAQVDPTGEPASDLRRLPRCPAGT